LFSKGYKIVSPKKFEIYVDEIKSLPDYCIVKVDRVAICKADLRYYLGNRDKRVLGLKYPMNLIHEAVGTVVRDMSGKFIAGEKVVLVPNLIMKCDKENCDYQLCNNESLGENYCPDAKFASSNYNSFSSDFVSYPSSNLVKSNPDVEPGVAVFSELISVAFAAIRRVKIQKDMSVGIFGDGILGYILCCVLREIFKVKIIVIGKHEEKLEVFPSDKYYLTDDKMVHNEKFDIIFEAVGGKGAESAVDSIVNIINPGGSIILTGVSEENIRVNTRKILEKGIALYGVTRSSVSDFEQAVKLLENTIFKNRISKLLLSDTEVSNISEFYNVFEKEVRNKKLGKYVIKFEF